MTELQIETAFAAAVNSKELKTLDISKFERYDLKNKPCSTAKKLEVLWKLDKLKLL